MKTLIFLHMEKLTPKKTFLYILKPSSYLIKKYIYVFILQQSWKIIQYSVCVCVCMRAHAYTVWACNYSVRVASCFIHVLACQTMNVDVRK